MSLIFFSLVLPVESPQAGFPYHQKYDFLYFDTASTTSFYTSLQPRIPGTCIPPILHFYYLWLDPLLKSNWRSVVEFFSETGHWLFMQRSSIVDVWQLCLRFPHKGILNSSCLLILLIHTKHKYNTVRCKLGLTPRSHFLEELIHWAGNAKSM